MNSNKETFETWNKIAQLYEDKFMNMRLYNETYDFICNNIKKENAELLEVGCGPGNIAKYLLSKRPDFKIHGIDIAPNMIALAAKNNPTASFSIMDCREINKIPKTFDGIIGGFCLPYLSETESEKLIFDAKNILNEGGLFYISFVEGDPDNSGFKVGSSGDRVYFYYHNLDIIKIKLLENSFKDLKIFEVLFKRSETENEVHTILIARKKAKE